MSGGHFDYNCFKIRDFADELEREIKSNKIKDEFGYCHNYNKKTISRLKKFHKHLTKVAELAKTIEWMYSGDVGEEDFIKEFDKNFKEGK